MLATGSIDVLRVAISDSTPTQIGNGFRPSYGIELKADDANTGIIYIGGPNVSSSKGRSLLAGESVFYPIGNTDQLHALSTVDGEHLIRTVL